MIAAERRSEELNSFAKTQSVPHVEIIIEENLLNDAEEMCKHLDVKDKSDSISI